MKCNSNRVFVTVEQIHPRMNSDSLPTLRHHPVNPKGRGVSVLGMDTASFKEIFPISGLGRENPGVRCDRHDRGLQVQQ